MKKTVLILGGEGTLAQQVVRGVSLSEEAGTSWRLGDDVLGGNPSQAGFGLAPSILRRLQDEVEVIVHVVGDAPVFHSLTHHRLTNVVATHHAVTFARGCHRLKRFLHISSTHAVGETMGVVKEEISTNLPPFTNAQEQTKWEAEQLVLGSWLPAEVLRVAPLLGGELVTRTTNPWLRWLGWLWEGYLPVVPAASGTRFDFVSPEAVGLTVARLLQQAPEIDRLVHLSQGDGAPSMEEFFACLHEAFCEHSEDWRSGKRQLPGLVDGEGFARFQQSVMRSQHPLYGRVVDQASYFLPSLLYPKVFATQRLQALGDAPFIVDWRALIHRVVVALARHQEESGSHFLSAAR